MAKNKIPIKEAYKIVDDLRAQLTLYCEWIAVAGSIRRGRPMVGDIELVAIPKIEKIPNLFGDGGTRVNHLQLGLNKFALEGWKYLKDGPRYKKIELPGGQQLDLFIVIPPAQWGVIYAIRTGPADFSRWIVTPRNKGGILPSDCVVKDGGVYRAGDLIPMPNESDYFDFLGLDMIPPKIRKWGIYESVIK